MKIALVRHEFRLHRGGGERYGQMLAAGLRDAGQQVHLFASHVDASLPEGIVHHPVRSLDVWSPLRHWSFARGVRRALDPADFDIVLALQPFAPCDVLQAGDGLHRYWTSLGGAAASRWTAQQPVKLRIEARAYGPDGAAHILAPSELVKRQAERIYGVASRRIDVVPPPIDPSRFAAIGPVDVVARRERWGVGPEDVLSCFVANNFSRKGLPTLLDAHARLGARFHLLVVGRDRRAESFRRRASELGLASRVHFVGAVDSVEEVLAASDALVHPSLYDPFGLVVGEAMAAGRPVIASRSTGASEWIEHGESGFVQRDPRDAAELAGWIERLADPSLRRAFGERAAESVRERDSKRHVAQTLEVLERVRAERAAPPPRAPAGVARRRVGSVEIVEESAATLERAGVASFAEVEALPVERVLHAVRPERRTDLVRIDGTHWVRKLYAGDPEGGAGEWRALLALAEEGLPGPPPIGFASSEAGSAVLMGFVEGEEQLDHWAARQLAEPVGDPRLRARRRRAVIEALADQVRAFHEAGFSHRDLYLCHLWVRERPVFRLRFMDLHRVERHARLPRRLRVKDLAALHFSAGRWLDHSRADSIRFLRRYLGVASLTPAHRRLARSVRRKVARMEHHNRGREI